MTLSELMICHDRSHTAALIESARALTDEALDQPVRVEPTTPAFARAAPTIREMLDRLVFTHEMWSAAIAGRAFEESADHSLDGMLTRLERDRSRRARRRDCGSRGSWDTAFVDATCDPPESFTFGGAVAHALTWDAHRRLIATSVSRPPARIRLHPTHSPANARRTSRAARASASALRCTPAAATQPRGATETAVLDDVERLPKPRGTRAARGPRIQRAHPQ